jgi:hypothetical protein
MVQNQSNASPAKRYDTGQIYFYQNHDLMWKYKVIFQIVSIEKSEINFKILWHEGYHFQHECFTLMSQWDRECRELTEEEKARLL